jgi:DNA-binding winged helix-turn-helix (wHTH) protein
MTSAAVVWSNEPPASRPVRLRIAVVRAIIDELERTLDDPAGLSSVGPQLEEELGALSRALRTDALRPMYALPAPEPTLPTPLRAVSPRGAGDATRMTLRFAGLQLELGEQRLSKDGQELRLRRKPFEILAFLVHRPRRLVTHAEIVDAVWGRIAMSESLLRTHIRELRRVIGVSLIETVIGRGYRLVVDVEQAVEGQ